MQVTSTAVEEEPSVPDDEDRALERHESDHQLSGEVAAEHMLAHLVVPICLSDRILFVVVGVNCQPNRVKDDHCQCGILKVRASCNLLKGADFLVQVSHIDFRLYQVLTDSGLHLHDIREDVGALCVALLTADLLHICF